MRHIKGIKSVGREEGLAEKEGLGPSKEMCGCQTVGRKSVAGKTKSAVDLGTCTKEKMINVRSWCACGELPRELRGSLA